MGRQLLDKKFKVERQTPSIMRRNREYTFSYIEKTQSNYLDGVINKEINSPISQASQNCEPVQVNGPITRSSIIYL